jgi:hypothetical protein
MSSSRIRVAAQSIAFAGALFAGDAALAQCPIEPPADNHQGAGSVGCPCFVPGEQAGATFQLPPSEYPIEITSVGIGWGFGLGGQPDIIEEAIHIYEGGLPDPGLPIFSQAGPVLVDGVINHFNLDLIPGQIIIPSGPFTVALEFLNDNSGGSPFNPTVVHDGDGCQLGRNVVFASPGIWADACLLGVTGDWVFFVQYRKLTCSASGPGRAGSLVLDKAAGTTLDLWWASSCSATDNEYSIYEGTLTSLQGGSYNHLPKSCGTGGATTANISPSSGGTYYLVVPRDDTSEGAYGNDGGGTPRPPAIATCRTPVPPSCP